MKKIIVLLLFVASFPAVAADTLVFDTAEDIAIRLLSKVPDKERIKIVEDFYAENVSRACESQNAVMKVKKTSNGTQFSCNDFGLTEIRLLKKVDNKFNYVESRDTDGKGFGRGKWLTLGVNLENCLGVDRFSGCLTGFGFKTKKDD